MKKNKSYDETEKFLLAKKSIKKIQTGLEKFSNNILVKSLTAGFVAAMPIIIVSSIFMLTMAIPEIFKLEVPIHYQRFANRIYTFTFGLLGMVVTGNITRELASELNPRLSFDKKINEASIMVAGMCAFIIMSVIVPAWDDATETGVPSINIGELGAKGVFPGIVIGLTTPWIFYFCNKYNITIRLPKAVPQVISKSFLTIIPWFFTLLIWGGIAYIFILILGQPFTPWLAEVLAKSLFKDTVASSYGMIVTYRILETSSWFIGVHPEAIQGVFENIMTINMASNADGLTNHAFVESLMGPAGNMGGTGSTFVVPIIMLLFCRSKQLKIAGQTSVVPVTFQVNEPILFGAPIVLNPVFAIPFITGPIMTSSLAKLFVDSFGLKAATVNVPWATPWFIRGPVAQLGQWQVFVLLAICFALLFLLWLPFIVLQDKIFLKKEISLEGEDVVAQNITGIQFLVQKIFKNDFAARKFYKKSISLAHLEMNKKIEQNPESKIVFTNEFNDIKTQLTIDADVMRVENLKTYSQNKLENKVDKIHDYFTEWKTEFDVDNKIKKIHDFNSGISKSKKTPKILKDKEHVFLEKELLARLKNEIDIAKYNNSSIDPNNKKINIEEIKNSRIEEINHVVLEMKEKNNSQIINGENPYVEKQINNTAKVEIKQNDGVRKILVLCIGAGTSAMLANSINKGARAKGDTTVFASALALGQYKDALDDVDGIITSPQLNSYFESIEEDATKFGITIKPTRGKQYIDLCNDKTKAYDFAVELLEHKE